MTEGRFIERNKDHKRFVSVTGKWQLLQVSPKPKMLLVEAGYLKVVLF